MIKFIIKRLLALIPVIIGVTFMVYFIMSLAPGDPALLLLGDDATPEQIAALREEMGLDDPFIVQYGRYMVNLVRGDMGTSYKTKNAVASEVFSRFPNTLILAGFSTLVSIVLALPLGVFAAVKQNSLFDTVSMVIALLGVSIPIFWFGLLLILFFAVGAAIGTICCTLFGYRSIWGSALILLVIFIRLAIADRSYEKELLSRVPHGH